jgi:DNA invertase Pin-like site-specific DNA recombinase
VDIEVDSRVRARHAGYQFPAWTSHQFVGSVFLALLCASMLQKSRNSGKIFVTETHPQNRRFGFARVSTVGQTLDSQLEQLRAAGCTTKIYREKVTGARNDRRELLKMLKHLAPGDVVTVTRIDRLARSTFDLFAIVKQIVDAKAQFRSLAEPWADTGTRTGRLMIAVLGGLADVERDLICTRTAEGRSRAQKRGQRMGRKPKLTAAQQDEAHRRRAQGATLAELARSCGVGKSTIRG